MKSRIPLTPYPVEIELKSHPESFRAVWSGEKTHEIRINDRKYKVAKSIRLQEYNASLNIYSGRAIDLIVTHIRFSEGEGIPFSAGLKPGYVVFDFVILNQYSVLGLPVSTESVPNTIFETGI